MVNLFCSACRARNNEEYRAVLKKRQARRCLIILAGFATEVVVLVAYFCLQVELSEYRLGFLIGMGAGLAFGGVLALLKTRRLLTNEEKLKEARLKETDEREIEVNNLAIQGTAKILLGVLYVLLILGGVLGDDKIMIIAWGLVAVFLLGDVALRRYYESKI